MRDKIPKHLNKTIVYSQPLTICTLQIDFKKHTADYNTSAKELQKQADTRSATYSSVQRRK